MNDGDHSTDENAQTLPGGPAPLELELDRGTSVGPYLVVEKVGEGGMGAVYAAYDRRLDRRIALKLVAAHPEAGIDDRERLMREAQAMARLNHPNVTTVYDVGMHGDAVYIAVEFVDGETLRDWLGQSRPWREVVEVMMAAGAGLAAAHDAGIVHRDFKPDNVLIRRDGQVLVTDFGLARSQGGVDPSDLSSLDARTTPSRLDVAVTRHGELLGTPAYMAPECFVHSTVDARADQWALGVTLYEAFFGSRPFEAETLAGLIERLQAPDFPLPSKPVVPSIVHRVLRRALARRPEDRFESVQALLDMLGRLRARRRRRIQVAALLGGALLVAGAAAIADFEPPAYCTGPEASLDSIWSSERIAAGEAAFAGFAGGRLQWQAFRSRAQQFRDEWSGLHDEACSWRANPGHQRDYVRWCLNQRRSEFAAIVELVETADQTVTQNAAGVLFQMDPASDCAAEDTAMARGAAATDPPAPEVSRKLARARVLTYAQLFEEADAATAELIAMENLSETVRAEALTLRFFSEVFRDRFDDALLSADLAVAAAVAAGRDDLAADFLIDVARFSNYMENPPLVPHGDRFLRLAEGYVLRVGSPPRLTRRLAVAQSIWHWRHGRMNVAKQILDEALAQGPDDDAVAQQIMFHMVGMVAELGHADQVLQSAQQAYELAQSGYGPLHPRTLANRHALSQAYGALGDLNQLGYHLDAVFRAAEEDEAPVSSLELIELSIVRLEAVRGQTRVARRRLERLAKYADHPYWGPVYYRELGMVERVDGDFPAAYAALRKARQLNEQWESRFPEWSSGLYLDIACAHLDGGQPAEALVALDHVSSGDDFREISLTSRALLDMHRARALALLDRFDEAAPLFERAVGGLRIDVELNGKLVQIRHYELGEALVVRGEHRLGQGNAAQAGADAAEALAVLADAGIDSPWVGRAEKLETRAKLVGP